MDPSHLKTMKTKVWNYAPDRDDCVVQTEESVVFENEHVGWFVANPDPNGRRRLDNMGVVERVGDFVFLACFSSRNALTPEFLGAVKDEATHLRQRVRERLKRREKLPLTYIAAFKALGWELD